jgi:hypothetical protein
MSEQQGYAEALGIDPSLISMLSQTSAETEKLKQRARDLGITLSPEDKKSLKEYNRSSRNGFCDERPEESYSRRGCAGA